MPDITFGYREFPTAQKLNDALAAKANASVIAGLQAQVETVADAIASIDGVGTLPAQVSALTTNLAAETAARIAIDTTLSNADQTLVTAIAAAQTAIATKQAALGFTPVRQGATAAVTIGASGLNLFANVDGTSIGRIWTDQNSPHSFADSGWQQLPSGLLFQYGYTTTGSSVAAPVLFPISFTYCFGVFVTMLSASNWYSGGGFFPRSVGVNTFDSAGFTVTTLQTSPGGATSIAPNELLRYLAIGY